MTAGPPLGPPQLPPSLVYSPHLELVHTAHSLVMRFPTISMILAHAMPALLMLTSMTCVSASPLAVQSLQRRSVTTLSQSQLDAFIPYAQFARATYCPTNLLSSWTCGEACNALPGFKPSLVGGDGNAIQKYFVGYWPSQNTVVVGHEGTDPTQLLSVLTDVDISLVGLDQNLFPGAPSSAHVHEGWHNEQLKTASQILAEVLSLLSSTGATSVTCVGHSLGGALAQLDSLMFALNLPSSVHIRGVTYGLPRVGDPAYATFYDSKVSDFQRINNKLDIVPILPGRFLGFHHPHGEIHLVSDTLAVACSGDEDDTDQQCTDLSVPNIFAGNILNHLGPYDGVSMGTLDCT